MKVFQIIGTALLASVLGASIARAQPNWVSVTPAPQAVGPMLQLRDGRILAHSDQGGNANSWYILTPDSTGHYETGTWGGPYNMQSGYSPFFFSSVVMLDGKTILIEGGEYNNGINDYTVLGSLGTLTPFGGLTWVANAPPTGWNLIGDAQNVLLANGHYLQANVGPQTAYYNGPNSWTAGPSVLMQGNSEAGYTALPNGDVLMVDNKVNPTCGASDKSTEYLHNGTWVCGPQTTVKLWLGAELGSAVLFYPNANHPQGGVFQFGGSVTATNVLDIASFTWSSGPNPAPYVQPDGPGALEPNGLVLEQVALGVNAPGCQFTEYDPVANTLTNTVNNAYCPRDDSFEGHLMIFPTGQIGSVDFDTTIYLYNPKPGVVSDVAPTIIPVKLVYLGGSKNNILYGIQLNGLTENNAYGDDYQSATNYPLIRFTNSSGQVYYGFTHDDSTHSIAPGTISYTKFDINPATPPGTYMMQVVTNGIGSNQVQVKIR